MSKFVSAVRKAVKKYEAVIAQYEKQMDDDYVPEDEKVDEEGEEGGEGDIIDMAAHDCVREVQKAMETYEEGGEKDSNLNNPIAKLQEYAQARGVALPTYTFRQSGESHIPTFSCTCTWGNGRIVRQAEGKTKQRAKRMAAKEVLKVIYKRSEDA